MIRRLRREGESVMKIRLIGQLKYRSSRVYFFTFYCCLFCVGLSACLSEGQGPVVTSQFSPRLAYPDAPYGQEVGDRIEDLRFVGLDGENVGLSELYFDSRTRLLLLGLSRLQAGMSSFLEVGRLYFCASPV